MDFSTNGLFIKLIKYIPYNKINKINFYYNHILLWIALIKLLFYLRVEK
jgi:hypothetical protein